MKVHILSFHFCEHILGIDILTFETYNTERSLFAVFYQPNDRCLWIHVFFINFNRFYI